MLQNSLKTSKLIIVGIFLAGIIFGMGMGQWVSSSDKKIRFFNKINRNRTEPYAATLHDQIYIDGDESLASFCTNGNGSFANPFVIENYEITPNNYDGIFINNTDTYLIIRNCVIQNGFNYISQEGYTGILMEHSKNIKLINNTVLTNVAGIAMLDVSNSIIVGNNCSANYIYGISLNSANGNLIIGNDCAFNGFTGITSEEAYNNIILGNNCTWNKGGISINNGNNLIFDNNLYNNSAFQGTDDGGNQWYYNQTGNYWGNYFINDTLHTFTNNGRIWNGSVNVGGGDCMCEDQDPYPLVNLVTMDLNNFDPSQILWPQPNNSTSEFPIFSLFINCFGVVGFLLKRMKRTGINLI